ncbi:MAG: hypothetical protein ACREJ2_04650 [Planctomycetota bacterium]
MRKRRFALSALAVGLTGLLAAVVGSGCAPSAEEWAQVDAMQPGPEKTARQADLKQRQAGEDGWWQLAAVAGTLAGGFVPGAGVAVAALKRARDAETERDTHAAAAQTLTTNLDQALVNLPADVRQQTLERIRVTQEAAGQRDVIRGYLHAGVAPAAASVATSAASAAQEAQA